MNDNEKLLIDYVCDGDIRKAQKQARIVLENLNTKKDENYKAQRLRRLDAKSSSIIELPYNLKELLIAEDVSHFPNERFLLRDREADIVNHILASFKASGKLAEMGIPFLPALLLHGESGCGKTMLARYIAHKADLPFVYVRFSSLVSSYLGSTQSNIAKVFDYARNSPCVLCFDEIDAVGMARGQKNDVGEMNRIVIALMQEMDSIPNNVIVIGTTNRYDRLDPALVRRFLNQFEIKPLNLDDATQLSRKFFDYTGTDSSAWIENWSSERFSTGAPASTVVTACTNYVVSKILEEERRKAYSNSESN